MDRRQQYPLHCRAMNSSPRIAALLFAIVLSTACGSSRTYTFRGESIAPGADGELEVTPRDGNYEIRLIVEHLLPPDRVDGGASTYVVWIQPVGRDPIHLGNLDYEPDDRRGRLVATTPHERFELFVTAEPSTTPVSPSGRPVVRHRAER